MSLLASSLASGNVSLSTSSSSANGGIDPVYGRGDIVFSGALSYSNANARTLTLTSAEDIWINGDITSTGGALSLVFNAPAGKKILINGDITTNGGSITVNNGTPVHFQKTSGVQTINTNGGSMSFGSSALKLLNTGGSLVLNSGAGALTLGSSGTIVQEGTFYQSPTRLLDWGGRHSSNSGITEKDYGIWLTSGRAYAMRLYYWDSWDGEGGEIFIRNGTTSSSTFLSYVFRAQRNSTGIYNINPSGTTYTSTLYQTSTSSNLGVASYQDQYVDVAMTTSFSGYIKTWNNLDQHIDDESLELYNLWETSFSTTTYNSGARTIEFNNTNTTQDACLISGVISGGLILKKSGTGTVKLSNYNTYTGGTTVDAGILQLHDSGISGNAGKGTINGELTINQNGTVQLSGNPAALGWWSTPYYANNRVTTLNINGGLLEAVGGQQHIWNMTGGVNFSEGGTIRSNGGTSSAAATSYIEWGGSNITVSNTNTNRPAVISGRVHLRNDYGEMTYTVNNNSQEYDLIFSAAITEASTTNLIKAGTGKLVFTGNNSARTGTTTVSAGTLVVGASNALGSGAVNLEAGTTLLTGRGITTLANNMVLNGNATLGLDKSVEVLLVGGGGGGASGGGGAGGVVSQSMSLNSGTYTVTVGAGGTGTDADQSNGNNGGQTTFNGVNAFGGGGGGKTATGGLSGASGGGTGSDATTAGGTATQGYAGGAGISTASGSGASGGGGAGAAGSQGWTAAAYNTFYGLSGQNTMGGNAGIGVLNAITGSATYYGGGGGGGCNNNAGTQPQERAGQGGLGGGGRGANANNGNGIAGTANTGGGGGGGDWEGFGANGGSGVVILRYAGATNGTGGTITNGTGSAIGFTIHTFNASGSFTLNSSTSLEVTGVVSGTGGLTYEANNGAITLSAANTYSGSTVISSGTLVLNTNASIGSASNTSTFTNNGIFTLKNGATFIPSPVNNSISGSGTYNVEKSLTGNSSTWTNTSGRFWYMGVPMKNVARNNYGTPGTTTNRVWSYAESTKSYSEVTNGSVLLSAGTGYVYRRSTDGTLTFTASGTNGLRDTDFTASGLTKTTGHSAGYHLISNPFMAYVDWHAVHTGATNMESTYYIRSNNSTNTNISALISYNKSTALATNNSSITATPEQLRYIAPLQSIWVRVAGAAGSTGSLSMSRSMLSHQSGNVGLKSSTVFPNLARVNLVDGNNFDQLLVYLNSDMSNEVDEYDSEKMPVAGTVQVYTMSSNKKLVMNGLKNNKKKVSVPLYLELPETKSYTLQLSEYQVEDGLILLEDKQEGTIQDFTLMENYTFHANSGLLQNRFVLHFILPNAELAPQGPSNSWVAAEEGSYTEGGDVEISNDAKGNIEITLNQAAAQKVEGTVFVTDMNGKEVYSGLLEGITTAIELDVPSGIYYLTVQSGTLIEKKKVFVQE